MTTEIEQKWTALEDAKMVMMDLLKSMSPSNFKKNQMKIHGIHSGDGKHILPQKVEKWVCVYEKNLHQVGMY
ncbi:MAG: hypothetical protein R2809_07125 [Flavobacteriales bacterium]